MADLRDTFNSIYKRSFWGKGTLDEPLSGPGSNPEFSAPYVDFVRAVIEKFGIKSVVDIGHGDWQMWKNFQFENVDYTGLEVSDYISNRVSSIHTLSGRKFMVADFAEISDELEFDLVISKDCFQHLPPEVVFSLISASKKSSFIIFCNDIYKNFESCHDQIKWAIAFRKRISSLLHFKNPFFINRRFNNMEIKAGDYTGIDLEREPFAGKLDSYCLILKFDFDCPARSGVSKRVRFFAKAEKYSSSEMLFARQHFEDFNKTFPKIKLQHY